MRRATIFFFLTVLSLSAGFTQHPYRLPQASSDILHDLELPQKSGRVLYLAAHPDDENTRVIAHLSRKEHIRCAYLSLTRGGGGQNLIGSERGELLSVLRTQELLQARRIDGGEQFFSRAKDFGYSKRSKETFKIWGKDRVLKDVVRVIREFRPHVIITRFPKGGYEGGHGHHTASAILAEKAFGMAGDPKAFPEQTNEIDPWQPKRLLFNTSTWWDKELPDRVDEEKDLFRVNVGKYDPYTGLSYTEIAAEARSMHKCQGFGVEKERGKAWEYFRVLKDRTDIEGSPSSIMDGVQTKTGHYKRRKAYAKAVRKARKRYQPHRPEKILPTLLKAYKAIDTAKERRWKKRQRAHLSRLILACSGTYIEATTRTPSACPGDSFHVELEFTHRSDVPMKVGQVQLAQKDTVWDLRPEENVPSFLEISATVPEDANTNTHQWLEKPSKKGVYRPPENDPASIVNAQPPAAIHTTLELLVDGKSLQVQLPVEHKTRSKVRGGVYEPFRVLPPITANSSGKAQVFPDAKAREIEVSYRAHRSGIEAEASLDLPKGWGSEPKSRKLRFEKKGESKKVSFKVSPPQKASKGKLTPYAKVDGERYQKREDRISYDHITPQLVIREAGIQGVQLNIGQRKGRVAYIMGSGDEVPEALEQLGYSVDRITARKLRSAGLEDYDVVITGVRAFNVHESLRYNNEALFEYAKEGGHLILQYNKDDDALVTDRIAPYPLVPSGDHRVTEESAEAKLLQPEHPFFNEPNEIRKKDFEGWVQERGLYFAKEWGDPFQPMISWKDQGESPKKGGLLLAEHGKGTIVYTGIAFFRQLPAGVPGAYRLFDNLVSYGIGAGNP